MAEFKLTDQEIGFISATLVRIDPAKMMDMAQSILAKINEYAQALQREQATKAADVVMETGALPDED